MDHLCDSDRFNCGLYCVLFILSVQTWVMSVTWTASTDMSLLKVEIRKGNSSKTDENRYIEFLLASTHLIIVHEYGYCCKNKYMVEIICGVSSFVLSFFLSFLSTAHAEQMWYMSILLRTTFKHRNRRTHYIFKFFCLLPSTWLLIMNINKPLFKIIVW